MSQKIVREKLPPLSDLKTVLERVLEESPRYRIQQVLRDDDGSRRYIVVILEERPPIHLPNDALPYAG